MEAEIRTAYFSRLFVPVVISILVLCAAAVVLTTPPAATLQWRTFETVFGGAATAAVPAVVGGAMRRVLRKK